MTFSIVGRDAHTGELGVAVSTAMPAVGAIVPWCRPGVGAVASQAISESAYGPRCLDGLAAGSTATEALAQAQAADPMSALRQVAVVGADGTVAVHTGALCVQHAGHRSGDHFSVQANMMSDPGVWPAMADSFAAASGPLARRLHAALVAGAAAGGDARGTMSAALVVVSGAVPELPGNGTIVDLRVDRSDDPVGDLGHLLDVADSYAGFAAAVELLLGGDASAALAAVDVALGAFPNEENLRFVRAGALAGTGQTDAAMAELRALVARRPTWEVVIRSFADQGLLTLPDGVSLDGALGQRD